MAKPGFFGTDGRTRSRPRPQFVKVPHLRNLYQKVGMFGMDDTFLPGDPSGVLGILPEPFTDTSFQGDQVRGFGFLHDGSVDTVFRFHAATAFATSPQNPGGFPHDLGRQHRRHAARSSRSCWRSTPTSRRSSVSRSR